jgi:hypothetical protein
MKQRRWNNRPDHIHPGDRAVFWFAVIGFVVLFVLGLLQ